ncbi:MAG TPA: plastocyanin/azurin family copper-binding protein [Mycobacteriales bacterium]|jgi:uncharacterized cupredoxin-like copper-binding protein
MRKPITTALFALLATGIASLFLVQLASAGPARRSATKTVLVKGGEFFFRLSTKSIARPGKVTFLFKNAGHVAHDFKINRRVTPLITPGKTAKLAVTFRKKGKYPYLCTVPGHAAAGMRGVFTVR